jgi:hypothetical protein
MQTKIVKSEHDIQNEIRTALSLIAVVYRGNVGCFQTEDGRYISSGLPKGFPDLFGFRKRDGKMFFIEVKTPAGRLSKWQELFGKNIRNFPVIYGVARSAEEALQIVREG